MKQPKFFQYFRIILFAGAITAGCVLSFILPLRPSVSESENRNLAEFPKFDIQEFFDGTYTSNISLWYSDTYPFREELILMNDRIHGLYGLKSSSSQGAIGGDEIDLDETLLWNSPIIEEESSSEELPPAETDSSDITAPPDETGSDTESENETETETETEPSGDVGHEVIGGYLVEGITGYELYSFNKNNSDRYARAVVQTALDLNGKAQVYCMVTPLAYTFGVDKDVQEELNASDLKDAITFMYNAIDGYCPQAGVEAPVITVDAYGALEKHKDEYIFFRTDHHWTGLGAHYASRAFLDLAGRNYPSLKDGYTEYQFGNFTGSLATHTRPTTPVLTNNPDTIYAYAPKSVNTVSITAKDGTTFDAPIVNPDAPTKFSNSQRYRCFIDGDYPYSVTHNPNIKDGSSILIIKESFGNALFPMLVDSYEYVYCIDYRFYRTMSLPELCDTYGIDTVLFINNPVATSADYNVRCLETLVNLASKNK